MIAEDWQEDKSDDATKQNHFAYLCFTDISSYSDNRIDME